MLLYGSHMLCVLANLTRIEMNEYNSPSFATMLHAQQDALTQYKELRCSTRSQ
jgi:hypothetical protein